MLKSRAPASLFNITALGASRVQSPGRCIKLGETPRPFDLVDSRSVRVSVLRQARSHLLLPYLGTLGTC
jgi:hypothetical protein